MYTKNKRAWKINTWFWLLTVNQFIKWHQISHYWIQIWPAFRGVLAMIPIYNQWWGFCSGTLGSADYLFTAITPMSTLTQSGSTYLAPIYWLDKSAGKLFALDRNNWYHTSACKFFVVTWSYNCLLRIIIIIYLKPCNCV